MPGGRTTGSTANTQYARPAAPSTPGRPARAEDGRARRRSSPWSRFPPLRRRWSARSRTTTGTAIRTARDSPRQPGDRCSRRLRPSTLIVVIGDSHMGQWLPALDTHRPGVRSPRVVPSVKDGCSPYDVTRCAPGGRSYTECQGPSVSGRSEQVHRPSRMSSSSAGAGSRATWRSPAGERPGVWTAGVTGRRSGLSPPLTGRLIVVGRRTRAARRWRSPHIRLA